MMPPRKFKKWTEQDDTILVEMYRAGKGFDEIALNFGVKITTVQQRLHDFRKAGIIKDPPRSKVKVWTETNNELLVKMHADGTPQKIIAAHFNTTDVAIHRQLCKLRKLAAEIPAAPLVATSNPFVVLEQKKPREVVLISPVHYLNAKSGQCRHFVNRAFMCGKPSDLRDRCRQHAG